MSVTRKARDLLDFLQEKCGGMRFVQNVCSCTGRNEPFQFKRRPRSAADGARSQLPPPGTCMHFSSGAPVYFMYVHTKPNNYLLVETSLRRIMHPLYTMNMQL
jgi:hypothetical protein